jgi:hypothetical protein
MPPFQSPQTIIREDSVRIVLAGLQHWHRAAGAQ